MCPSWCCVSLSSRRRSACADPSTPGLYSELAWSPLPMSRFGPAPWAVARSPGGDARWRTCRTRCTQGEHFLIKDAVSIWKNERSRAARLVAELRRAGYALPLERIAGEERGRPASAYALMRHWFYAAPVVGAQYVIRISWVAAENDRPLILGNSSALMAARTPAEILSWDRRTGLGQAPATQYSQVGRKRTHRTSTIRESTL